jgi:hypothetical protein
VPPYLPLEGFLPPGYFASLSESFIFALDLVWLSNFSSSFYDFSFFVVPDSDFEQQLQQQDRGGIPDQHSMSEAEFLMEAGLMG